jgi:hypothetical protein
MTPAQAISHSSALSLFKPRRLRMRLTVAGAMLSSAAIWAPV